MSTSTGSRKLAGSAAGGAFGSGVSTMSTRSACNSARRSVSQTGDARSRSHESPRQRGLAIVIFPLPAASSISIRSASKSPSRLPRGAVTVTPGTWLKSHCMPCGVRTAHQSEANRSAAISRTIASSHTSQRHDRRGGVARASFTGEPSCSALRSSPLRLPGGLMAQSPGSLPGARSGCPGRRRGRSAARRRGCASECPDRRRPPAASATTG